MKKVRERRFIKLEKTGEYFEVDTYGFYNGMIGEKVFETQKTIMLRFELNDFLGGVQNVHFYKEQLMYYDSF